MRRYFFIALIFTACSSPEQDQVVDEVVSEPEFVSPEMPDHNFYVDDKLVEGVDLSFGEGDSNAAKPVFAEINGEEYEVLEYEGLLSEASGNSNGYVLKMEPYSYWDDDLETEVKSKYDFYLYLDITREQNKYLDFVISSEETDNLKWDYHENLFEVFFYLKDGSYYPLKFINHGKTEWDG